MDSLAVLQGSSAVDFSLLLQTKIRSRMVDNYPELHEVVSVLTWDWSKSKHIITWQPLAPGKSFEEEHADFLCYYRITEC